MKKRQDKVAASVTVYQVADMTTKGRKAVCGWLRKLANDLQREPDSFAKRFRARYVYRPNDQDNRAEGKPADDWYKLYCQEVSQNRIKPTDDTEGSPVGWTIEAIGRDGSILCRSPNGKRRRYQIEFQLDGLGD